MTQPCTQNDEERGGLGGHRMEPEQVVDVDIDETEGGVVDENEMLPPRSPSGGAGAALRWRTIGGISAILVVATLAFLGSAATETRGDTGGSGRQEVDPQLSMARKEERQEPRPYKPPEYARSQAGVTAAAKDEDDGGGDGAYGGEFEEVAERLRARNCCREETPQCLACKADQPLAAFCQSRAQRSAPGCEGFCGLNEDSYNYVGGDFRSLRVTSTLDCCAACRAEPLCTSWTWGKRPGANDENVCYLKSQLELHRVPDEGYISGLPGSDDLLYQVRTSQDTCVDVDHSGSLGAAACGSVSDSRQQWSYDRMTGIIRTAPAHGSRCLQVSAGVWAKATASVEDCSTSELSQRWIFDSELGQLQNFGGLCLVARQVEGSFVPVMESCEQIASEERWVFSLADAAIRKAMALIKTTTTVTSTTVTTTTVTTLPRTTTVTTQSIKGIDASLFCWSLMLPWGYEPDLLRMQIAERRSIFACEDFVVYSSVALDLGSGYVTERVDTDLHCPLGGPFHTALNTPIFQEIWGYLIRDGRYLLHEWTVKADPDAVFLPERLRDIVRTPEIAYAAVGETGVFLNNCKYGLHGPIEVVSKRALHLFSMERKRCDNPPQEDVYLRSCMLTVGVLELNQWNVLAEAACESPDWQSCHSAAASFHPFKTLSAYRRCQEEAEKVGTWSSKELEVYHGPLAKDSTGVAAAM